MPEGDTPSPPPAPEPHRRPKKSRKGRAPRNKGKTRETAGFDVGGRPTKLTESLIAQYARVVTAACGRTADAAEVCGITQQDLSQWRIKGEAQKKERELAGKPDFVPKLDPKTKEPVLECKLHHDMLCVECAPTNRKTPWVPKMEDVRTIFERFYEEEKRARMGWRVIALERIAEAGKRQMMTETTTTEYPDGRVITKSRSQPAGGPTWQANAWLLERVMPEWFALLPERISADKQIIDACCALVRAFGGPDSKEVIRAAEIIAQDADAGHGEHHRHLAELLERVRNAQRGDRAREG